MNLKEIKQLTARIRIAALSDNVPNFESTRILDAINQIEQLCEAQELDENPVIQERADVGNLVEKLWPDAPQEIKSKIMGPINGSDWIGEPVEEMTKAIIRAKAEYQDRPWTQGADRGRAVQEARKQHNRKHRLHSDSREEIQKR